jgi:hypothetical protein
VSSPSATLALFVQTLLRMPLKRWLSTTMIISSAASVPQHLSHNPTLTVSEREWSNMKDWEIKGDDYEEIMKILNEEFGADLLPDSELDIEIQIKKDFYAEPKD